MSEKEWITIFSENLKTVIQEAGMNPSDLSEETGIDRSTINRYLNGRSMPTLKSIINIAYSLNIDLDELIVADERIE